MNQDGNETPGQVFQDVAAKWFGEALVGLPNLALNERTVILMDCNQTPTHLKELNDGAWEGERRRLLLHILGGELVLNHELGKVAHDLAARCHLISLDVQTHQYNPRNGASNLDNVTEEQVGLAILLFHHLKLVAQTQAATLMLWTIAFK